MHATDTVLKEELARAKSLIAEGKKDEAREKLLEVLKEDPENTEIHASLCSLFLLPGMTDIPLDLMTKAVRQDPTLSKGFITLSTRLYEEGKLDECEQILKKLVRADPENHEAWNDLGAVGFAQQRFPSSEDAFKRALALNPAHRDALFNLTSLYLATNRRDHAVRTALTVRKNRKSFSRADLEELAGLIKWAAPEEAKLLLREDPPLKAAAAPAPVSSQSDEEKKVPFDPQLKYKGVVWYCTMKCNNRCPYCLAFQVDDPMIKVPFRDYREWVEVWNRFEGELLLDITGGEPFLFPNIIELIQELKDTTRVAITTNTRCDLTKFVQAISPEKCVSITASMHPSAYQNTEDFLGKIMLLKNRGFRVVVNYVSYPEQLWMIPYYKKLVEGVGIPFHIDPYGPGPKRPYKLSEKEETFLRQFVGGDRGDFFNREEVLYRCSGGMNFFSTLPNGDTYTCVTKRYVKENFVGNLFDEDFRPFTEPIRCKAISCAGCDLDKVLRVPNDKVKDS